MGSVTDAQMLCVAFVLLGIRVPPCPSYRLDPPPPYSQQQMVLGAANPHAAPDLFDRMIFVDAQLVCIYFLVFNNKTYETAFVILFFRPPPPWNFSTAEHYAARGKNLHLRFQIQNR